METGLIIATMPPALKHVVEAFKNEHVLAPTLAQSMEVRGEMGSLPADSEQFMMIENLYTTTDKINKHIENMALNKVNIEFLRKQMDKVLEDIEELKDKNRDMYYNGNGAKQ